MQTDTFELYDKLFFDEIMCIADTKMVLAGWYMIAIPNGRAIADWASTCGMMQDHYGHARALFTYLGRYGLTREEAEWTRSADEIRGPAILDAPPASWTDFIVSSFLVEQALATLLSAHKQNETDPEFAGLASKIVKESLFHLSYLKGWLTVLESSQNEALLAAISKRLPAILEWWGPADAADPLADSRLRPAKRQALRMSFLDEVGKVLPIALQATGEQSGKDWDPETMRTGAPGIPASLFEIIRFKNIELAMP